MSHIFDALQRSAQERSEAGSSALSGATEMLRLAERQAASKRETIILSEQPDMANGTDRGTSFGGLQIMPPAVTARETFTEIEPSPTEERAKLFSQFQSLQVSLPAHSRLPSLTESGSPAAEAFRLLGVRLRHLRRDRSLKKVLITSTIPQEGKSTVAANLACTLALKTNQRILVLEGDLRRPSLSRMFGLRGNPGLCEMLGLGLSITKGVYHLERPNLWILPAGSAPSNALELLQSGRLYTMMDQLSSLFDWIIIDSPPVLPLADTSVWMRLADGILLATRQGTTEKRQLKRGMEAIEPEKLIGALVNSSTNATTSDYYYGPAPTQQE
jgi:capsular exopolysaccharide synthesis family protein